MASRGRGAGPSAADYEQDYYSWLLEQARLIRDGRWGDVDRESLAREIEALAHEQYTTLETALRVLLTHLFKWDHPAIRRSPGRVQSVQSQRRAVSEMLARNPGLSQRVAEAIANCYRRARAEAAEEVGLDESSFPAKCPYDWDGIVAREFSV